jgi:hypothetical protein
MLSPTRTDVSFDSYLSDGDASRRMGVCDVAKGADIQSPWPCFPMDRSQDSEDQSNAKSVGVFGECSNISVGVIHTDVDFRSDRN